MKKIFIALLFLVIMVSLSASVSAFELEVKGSQMIFSDRETKAGPGIEARLKVHDLHLFLSEERIWVYGDWIRLNGFGVGFSHSITERFSFHAQIGYYVPDYREDQFCIEQLGGYQNKYLAGVTNTPTWWPRYTANWADDFGGELGISYRRQIYSIVSVGFSLSYRCLSLNEMVTSYKKMDSDDVAWFVEQNRDFGGPQVGVQITAVF